MEKQITAAAVAYRATVFDYDGITSETPLALTAAEADTMIGLAVCDGDEVTVDPDRSGRFTLIRALTGRSTATGPARTLRKVTRLVPTTAPRTMTARQYEDLTIVHERENARTAARLRDGRVDAGLQCVPLAATGRLLGRGWLTADPSGEVWVSYAGRIAMALHEHRAEILFKGLDKLVRRADGSESWEPGGGLFRAACSCGHRGEGWREERRSASRDVREHRRAFLLAVMLA
ncbi:hypothetical protein [Streptomyces sp. NRRL F-5630]|uniref:hypothetical protein n=1 Tax=Streptomyces sp. NRRL F-5630 TaxID=1463864 RepID=UPI003D72F7CF